MINFKFSNLGPMQVGEIGLSKLTVLCGENNTGKTYVTYLAYCFLATWKQFIEIDLDSALKEIQKLGSTTIDLENVVESKWHELTHSAVERFKENLPDMLASKTENFKNLELEVRLPLSAEWRKKSYKKELRSNQGNLLVTLSKLENSTSLEIAAPSVDDAKFPPIFALNSFIEEEILSFITENIIPNVFIASTERTGATTFKKQLNLALNNFLELLGQLHKDGADSITPRKLFETMYESKDYALPVEHNVKFINTLPTTNKEDGALFKANPELLKEFEGIVGGTYITNKDGVTYFRPKGTSLSLGLGEVSSSVRSLMLVWYWLKYIAKPKDMLMLDEPELNLHPANQRRLARFIARLVNLELQVFLTTHSDYIIREFNTLIMLNQSALPKEALLKKLKDYTEADRLNHQDIAVYMARKDKIQKPGNTRKTVCQTIVAAEISPTLGIEALSFDETIDEMNAVQEAIYYANH